MPRSACIALALAVGASIACAQSVHLRTADGSWVEVEARQQQGRVGFTIGADQTDAGRTLIVVNPPDWMVLDDETAPRAAGYALGEHEGGIAAGETLDLGGIGTEPPQLVFEVTDDDNPVDAQSARLKMEGHPNPEITVLEEDREERRARIAIDFGELGPGAYHATLEVTDLAPLANTLELPLSFSIAGAQIADDGQSIALSAGGASFTVRAERRENVIVDAAGVAAYITVQPEDEKHLYVREFTDVVDHGGRDGLRVIEAEVALMNIDGEPVEAKDVGARLSYRFALHADISALVVRSVATNLVEPRTMYTFWGWLPGDGYVTPDGESHAWSMSYDDIGRIGRVHLPSAGADPGVGWISDHFFGESRFGTMLLYTEPRRPTIGTGESVEMSFALTPATDPEQVRLVAEQLVEEGLLQLPE